MQYLDPRGGSSRYKINKDFFKKWSKEMAYVLGFLYADGCIIDALDSSRTRYFSFFSRDKDLLNDIKRILQSDHPLRYRAPRKKKYPDGKIYESKEAYLLRIASKEMYADLENLGLMPNKSKTIKFPDFIPNKYFSHFTRGYFDGDGCVHISTVKNKNGQRVFKKLNVIFTSGSKLFLEGLNNNLEKSTTVSLKNINYSHRAYQLRYCTKDSIELFKFLYKNTFKEIYLKRKLEIFLRYFYEYSLKIDRKTKNIFNNLKMARYPSS